MQTIEPGAATALPGEPPHPVAALTTPPGLIVGSWACAGRYASQQSTKIGSLAYLISLTSLSSYTTILWPQYSWVNGGNVSIWHRNLVLEFHSSVQCPPGRLFR